MVWHAVVMQQIYSGPAEMGCKMPVLKSETTQLTTEHADLTLTCTGCLWGTAAGVLLWGVGAGAGCWCCEWGPGMGLELLGPCWLAGGMALGGGGGGGCCSGC